MKTSESEARSAQKSSSAPALAGRGFNPKQTKGRGGEIRPAQAMGSATCQIDFSA